MFNVCIIPDLPIDKLKNFVRIFKWMLKSETANDLMYGNISATTSGKGSDEKITYEAKRPLIFKGNFPNPPKSSALGSVALLGTIGEFAKQSQYSEQAKSVLESLKDTTMYLIKYGGATTFTFNHYVIDLAKEGKLRSIILNFIIRIKEQTLIVNIKNLIYSQAVFFNYLIMQHLRIFWLFGQNTQTG